MGDKGHKASDSIGTLHVAHFVPFEHNHIGFFTVFDGDMEKYFQDFADKTSFVFDALFPHVVGAPPTPVAKNAQAFYQWALDNNYPPIGFYSAYPGLSVQDIRALLADSQVTSGHRWIALGVTWSRTMINSGSALAKEYNSQGAPAMKGPGLLRRLLGRRRHEPPGTDGDSAAAEESALDLADIQGFVLRGYRMPMVRHFLLTVGAPAQARRQLGRLVSGDESDVPQITTAEDWHVGFAPGPGDDPADAPRRKPDYCLNIGITWPGLVALEIEERVPTLSFKSFGAFIEGAAQRAELVGDTGASSPENWIGGFGRGDDHVLVTLHAISPEAMDGLQRQVVCLVCRRKCLSRNLAPGRDGVDGDARWPTRAYGQGSLRIYRRNHVRPPFAAARNNIRPITSSPASHGSSSCGKTLRTTCVPEPRQLGLNGSFAVFKKVETDVVGFEDFLQSNKDKIDPELLAAKMCGRWRNGVPLALSPDTDSPAGGISPEQLNDFEYVDADGSGDPKGIRCPVGAHIRRVNPRGQPVAGQGVPGGSNNSHRLIRRGLPYGPTYDPSEALRWHRARDALSFHQLEHRKPIRVRAATVGQ